MLTSRAKSKHAYLKTHPSLLQKWVVSSQYNFLTSQRLISHTAGSWEVGKGLPANLRAECPEVWLRLPSWGSSLLGVCTRAVTGAFGNFPNLPVGENRAPLIWCCVSESVLHYQSSEEDFVLLSQQISLHCPYPLLIKPQQRWELLWGRNFILMERCFKELKKLQMSPCSWTYFLQWRFLTPHSSTNAVQSCWVRRGGIFTGFYTLDRGAHF